MKVRSENPQAQPSPRTSFGEDILTRRKLPPHRLENTSIRANLASAPCCPLAVPSAFMFQEAPKIIDSIVDYL